MLEKSHFRKCSENVLYVKQFSNKIPSVLQNFVLNLKWIFLRNILIRADKYLFEGVWCLRPNIKYFVNFEKLLRVGGVVGKNKKSKLIFQSLMKRPFYNFNNLSLNSKTSTVFRQFLFCTLLRLMYWTMQKARRGTAELK